MRLPQLPGSLAALLAAALVVGGARPCAGQSLRGSRASVDRMYRRARAERLPFYATASGVRAAARRGALVRLTSGPDAVLHAVGFPYVKLTTRTFVRRLAPQYRAACGERLVVTSAVRPSTRQPENSVARSVHPTGMAVDLRRPTGTCLRWLRATLLALEGAGLLEATEEHAPAHFHVAVFPSVYARYVAGRTRPAPAATVASRTANVHRVRTGDTLWAIARAHETSVERIVAANALDGAAIVPGQSLVIPGGGDPGVATGDGDAAR